MNSSVIELILFRPGPLGCGSVIALSCGNNCQSYLVKPKRIRVFMSGVGRAMLAAVMVFNTLFLFAQEDEVDLDKEFEKTAQLIVMVQAGDDESARFGAGIIFGREKDRLLIATAYHTLRNLPSLNIRVQLRNMPQDRYVPAKLLRYDPAEGGMDMAVLSVESLQKEGIDACALPFDRLGKVNNIKRGDPVFAIGNPNGVSWAMPIVPDKISQINRDLVDFQSNFISKGHSGGGLLDERGNLIGMTIADAQPFGRAINLGSILQQVKKWGYAAQLDTLLAGARTPLHIAAMKGDLPEIKFRLADCGNPNAVDFHNATPLHYAASKTEALPILLKAGANPNILDTDGDLPAEWAIEKKCFACVELLVKSGTKISSQNKKGETLLHIAIDSGQQNTALFLIQSGTDINIQDKYGNTALHVAARRNQAEIIDALLRAKANVNVINRTYSRTPLGMAVENDNQAIALKLVKAGCRTDLGYPLHIAVAKGFVEMIKLLSTYKTDVNLESEEKTPLGLAILNFDDHHFITNNPKRIYDVKHPSMVTVKALIDAGANVNKPSTSFFSGQKTELPLMLAIKKIMNTEDEVIGGEELLRLLIKTGDRKNINWQDVDGNTPLLIVVDGTYVKDKELKFAKILLEGGADPNIRNKDGKTALDGIEYDPSEGWAKNNVELLKLLVKAGAKVNGQNHLGRLPLLKALYPLNNNKSLEFVKILLDAGADPNLKDKSGETAMQRARYHQNPQLIQLLTQHGGK